MTRFLRSMLTRSRGRLLTVLALGCSSALLTQAPATADNAANSADADDAAAKNAIFNSDEWRRTRAAFDDWLSVQRMLNAQQVEDTKTRLRKQIAAKTAPELQTFLEQMQAKLAILLSPEAGEARQWLGHFVSPEVIFTREEIARFDIVNMSVAQLEATMRTFESRRAARRSQGAAFNASRQQQAARTSSANQQRQQTQQQNRAAAQSAARARASQQAALAPPRRPPPPPRPRPQIFLGPTGGVGFALPVSP